jgi:site-specific DNA-cytosine methylase
VQAHRPKYVILENVLGVLQKTADSNTPAADQILKSFQKLGYEGVYTKVDSRDYLLPQRRNRVYFFLRDAGTARVDWQHTCISTMNLLRRAKCFDLLSVLNREVIALHVKPKAGSKYKELHDKFARDNGIDNLFEHDARVRMGSAEDVAQDPGIDSIDTICLSPDPITNLKLQP